jgi:hypothetical protein
MPPPIGPCRATRKNNHPPWRSIAFDENFEVHVDWYLRVLFDKDVKLVK